MASFHSDHEKFRGENIPSLHDMESGKLVGAVLPMSEQAQMQMQAQMQADSFRHQLQMQNLNYLQSHPEQFPELNMLYGNLSFYDAYKNLPWNRSKNIKLPTLKKLTPDKDE